MKNFGKLLLVFLQLSMSICCTSCSNEPPMKAEDSAKYINLVSLCGPSSLALLRLIKDSEEKISTNFYNVSIIEDEFEFTAKILNDDVDIAIVPVTTAAKLYNKNSSNMSIVAITSFSSLYILSSDPNINSIEDLKGHLVSISEKNGLFESILHYILKENNISKDDIKENFINKDRDFVKLLVSENIKLGLISQPFASQVLNKNRNVKVIVDCSKELKKINKYKDFPMECVIVKNKFIKNNNKEFKIFIDEYKKSLAYTTSNAEEVSLLADNYGIMQKEILKDVINKCHLVYLDGKEMKDRLEKFYNLLFSLNKSAIGSILPNEKFYYINY